jgi:LCP family protein required for cell wall assembly
VTSLLRAESPAHLAKPEVAEAEVDHPRRRRRRIRRLLIAVNVVLATAVLLLGSALTYAFIQESRLKTIEIPSGDDPNAALASVPKGAPLNILVVGSDSRSAAKDAKDKKQFGTEKKVDGQRSDTMMVIRLDPKNDKATILSIPRDMYVDLEGGGKGRINEAFASVKDRNKADPDRLIRTITKNFGIPINHYVEIDFFGFRDAVNAVGGVKVWFEFPAKDDYSLLNIPNAGCVQLNGDSALSYVRARHFEYKQNGRWKTDPTSDFGRIKRQQDFIRRLVRKAVAEGLTNPIKAHKLIEAGIDNVQFDTGFGLKDMKSLASQLKNLNEGGLTFLSIPGDAVMVNGDSVLRLDKSGANDVLVAFGAKPLITTTTTTPKTTSKGTSPPAQKVDTGIPAGTTVRVYNTTTKGGLATSTATALKGLGVATATGGNRAAVPSTEIHHPAGGEAAAAALQALIGGGATLKVDPTVRKGELVLLIGSSFTAIQPPAAATPPTTAPAATTPAPTVTTPSTLPALGSDPSKLC